MTALTVDSAKNLAIALAVGLVALMLLMAVVIKNITTKLVTVLIIAGLAFGVWTQRASLQTCADKVRSGTETDSTCSFFGSDINVPVP